jgi:hypothetical protein
MLRFLQTMINFLPEVYLHSEPESVRFQPAFPRVFLPICRQGVVGQGMRGLFEAVSNLCDSFHTLSWRFSTGTWDETLPQTRSEMKRLRVLQGIKFNLALMYVSDKDPVF